MPDGKQILIVHDSLWTAMERFAERNNLRLDRIPDGADDNGVPYFTDWNDGENDGFPTYAFMPK